MNQPFIPYLNAEHTRNQMNPPAMLLPMKLMLARAYVLDQPYTGLFPLDKALKVGTIFPNMYEAFPKRK